MGVDYEEYWEKVKNLLEPKDGYTHVLLLETLSYGVIEYTNKLNKVLVNMQKEGYEIIDVKSSTIFSRDDKRALILYK